MFLAPYRYDEKSMYYYVFHRVIAPVTHNASTMMTDNAITHFQVANNILNETETIYPLNLLTLLILSFPVQPGIGGWINPTAI